MAKLFVLGDFNIDLVLYLDRLPNPGETLNANRFFEGPGGKGSNQAIAAARLGADVRFFGAIGNDYYGQVAVKAWQDNGVNTDYLVQNDDYETAMALINVDANGDNTITVHQGANLRLTTSDVDAAKAAIAESDIVMCTLGVSLDIVAYTFGIAKAEGTTTLLNPAPAAALSEDLLQLADYVIPNESELAVIAGKPITDDNVTEQARQLLARTDQTMIVTLGAEGAQWITQADSAHIPTFSVDVVDTVGAGDAFNAGFAVALAEGRSLDDAIRFANANAALSVQTIGAVAGMPLRAAVDDFLTG